MSSASSVSPVTKCLMIASMEKDAVIKGLLKDFIIAEGGGSKAALEGYIAYRGTGSSLSLEVIDSTKWRTLSLSASAVFFFMLCSLKQH